jgi:uncharacterized damage-inducible protein DinB
MTLAQSFLTEMEREAARSKRALEAMPEGKADWKPHDKSMQFGYLAEMVATIPNWIVMQLERDELDIAPVGEPQFKREPLTTRADYVAALDKSMASLRRALQAATDDHLETNWRLLARGAVVAQGTRREMIRDTINHLAHHRGQMTVYLRLMGAKVPALYGPSADDQSFG